MAKGNSAKATAAPVLEPDAKPSAPAIQSDPKANGHKDSGVPASEGAPESLPEKVSRYPEGTKLWTYKSKAGETIELPLEFDKPDKLWLWELKDQPFLSQTWAWLERAGVPRDVQRQCVSLPDDEYMDMFSDWFSAMGGGATPGE